MSAIRTLSLFVALAGSSFANVYFDFNNAIDTFNTQVNSWNSGPLGVPAFNNDILTFDTAVNSFNLATGGSYADVGVMGAYGAVAPYPGSSLAIGTFNLVVNSFNISITSFETGSMDRPDFAAAVANFNTEVIAFNLTVSPPVSTVLPPPTYSLEESVTDPGTSTPEPSSVCLTTLGLGLVARRSAQRRLRSSPKVAAEKRQICNSELMKPRPPGAVNSDAIDITGTVHNESHVAIAGNTRGARLQACSVDIRVDVVARAINNAVSPNLR